MKRFVVAAFAAAVLSQAVAASPPVLYPVQTGAETVRYMRGVPTLNLETPTGAMQVTPLPFDHGHVVFGIGVYNKGAQPANFGIENVVATLGAEQVVVLSEAELAKRAKSRAAWSQVGIALLAGAAAAAAAQAHTTQHYDSVMHTPHGVYSWRSTYTDNTIGALGAAAAVGGGAAGIVGVQNRLDFTLANYASEVIQTTTVEPDASYGGKLVLEKPKASAKLPYDVRIVMRWNGLDYPFVFRVTKQGVAVPAAYASPPTPLPPTPASAAIPTPASTSKTTTIASSSPMAL